MKAKRVVVDIDGTLCSQRDFHSYHEAEPIRSVINLVNQLYFSGWHVTLFTARGMNTFNEDVTLIEENLRFLTEKWLEDNSVFYDRLLFGKPSADIYIDDKAVLPSDSRKFISSGKLVFTNGCFDLLHNGHIATLKFARDVAGEDGTVVVGLNSDDSIRRLKGHNRPVQDQNTRKLLLESMKYVDRVVIFDEDSPEKLIAKVKPDVIVKGSDYVGLKVVGSNMASVKFAPFVSGVSTSEIIKRITGHE